ncbi:GNAT family N-acetyltransferase [Shewanella donghaensis]|uniref:GNAT family N-acetyltransferase n=1 Tax=Shewanella donghaensis TaxID=238836 RepID=UPI001183FC66|nr:GNAT family N-acetyltransferase [Shewanella donghaensis]
MKFEVINEENKEVLETLVNGVREHRFEHMGSEDTKPLSVVSRDENGHILGGIAGRTIYRNFLIEVLWVDKATRGSGLGRQLMEMAEVEAIKRGCVLAQLDTLDYQAPEFYKKLGFEIAGSVAAFTGSPERIFLTKKY